MIDPAESHSLVFSSKKTAGQAVLVFGHFTAPEDLTLRAVIFSWTGPEQANYQVLSSDPDLTPMPAGTVVEGFQLIATTAQPIQDISTPGNFLASSFRTVFENLSFPLARGQTLYWGGQAADELVQLFFS